MKEYKLDYDLSKEMYDKHKLLVKQKECYNNIAKISIAMQYLDNYNENIKIAFGAWQIFDDSKQVYARHCFFLLDNEKVIDPTCFVVSNKINDRSYLVFKTYDLDDYDKKLRECNLVPSIDKYTEKIFRKAQNILHKDNVILI